MAEDRSRKLAVVGSGGRDVAPAKHSGPQQGNVADAMSAVATTLQQAITGMDADDIDASIELEIQDGQRSTARFKLRAYRRGQQIVDVEK